MRRNTAEDAGFTSKLPENPTPPWADRNTLDTPAETARRDMREIADRYAVPLRKALADAGFKLPIPAKANDNEPRGLEIAIVECDDDPGAWTVEAIDTGSEGEIYQAIFAGPNAEQRAIDYARWMYGTPSGYSR